MGIGGDPVARALTATVAHKGLLTVSVSVSEGTYERNPDSPNETEPLGPVLPLALSEQELLKLAESITDRLLVRGR